jgi:hypothetical protein
MFPVRYELNVYILCIINQSLRASDSEGSQSRQRVKYFHESRGTRNQRSLCWRGPAEILQSVFKGLKLMCFEI